MRYTVLGITDLLLTSGMINVDFADFCTTLSNAGEAFIGFGSDSGKHRVGDAINAAFSSFDGINLNLTDAKRLILNIVGGKDMTLRDVNQASEMIRSKVSPSAHIVFGAVVDDTLTGVFAVTLIITGFGPDDDMHTHSSSKAMITWKEEEEVFEQIERLEESSPSHLRKVSVNTRSKKLLR